MFLFLMPALYCDALPRVLSLRECIALGIEKNFSLQNVREDIYKAGIGRSESRSRLLPMIQAYGNFTNNTRPMTNITDGSGIGSLLGIDMPYMSTTGLRYVTSGGTQLSMPLYDQTIYTRISIAEKMEKIAGYSYEKAKEDLTVEIGHIYFLAQTTARHVGLIRENIGRLEELGSITVAYRDNGMALDVDVKRVDINLENLKVQFDNSNAMYRQQLNLLRYILDLPPELDFMLEPIREDIDEAAYLYAGLSEGLYELKILDAQAELVLKQKQAISHAYIPTLSLVGQVSYTNFTDHFDNYFKSHPSNNWHNNTYWGLSLKIPIFDGMVKRNKIKRANADYRKLQTAREDTGKNLETQYRNALNDWDNHNRNLKKQSDNYQLAGDVYAVTTDRYKEGMASMTEVLQDELKMNEAQGNYVSALYNRMASELKLLKLTGRLNLLTQ